MLALQKAGTHVIFQLNGRAPGQVWINGALRQEWGYEYYDHFREIVDGFEKLENTLGFFFGVSAMGSKNKIPVREKASVIHRKEYIQSKKYRNIPVGWMNQVSLLSFNMFVKLKLICYIGVRTRRHWFLGVHQLGTTSRLG